MKEAAGEANMTVITIVLIGVVAGVGLLLVPRLMSNAKVKACCTDVGYYVSGTSCCNPNTKTCSSFTYMKKKDLSTTSVFYDCMHD